MIVWKYYRLLLLLSGVSLFLLSCEKEEEMSKYPPLGTFTAEATLNDTSNWQANSVFAGKFQDSGDTFSVISLDYFIGEGCWTENLKFYNIPISEDIIKLHYTNALQPVSDANLSTVQYSALDCDALGEIYHLLERNGTDNFIKINEIEKYNFTQNIEEISGTFEITLVRDTTIPKIIFPNRPDTLRMTDGTFNANVIYR